MSEYSCRTLEQLFLGYQNENARINQHDAKATKERITLELYRRLKDSLDKLDKAETEQDAQQILKQFIEF